MIDRIKEICISQEASIISALKQMDAIKHKLLIVIKDKKFYSLLSIGDIQRAIIKGVDMNSPISTILREKTKVASVNDDMKVVKATMKERSNEFMPIVDDDNNLVDVIFWEDLFESQPSPRKSNLNLPVIIMAGGQGSRLRPLTNILPKPLIPIGEQTMMEDIMDRFVDCGCKRFYISVNYKADTIKRYFDNLEGKPYKISYFQEDKPLGTAGSLHLLNGQINTRSFELLSLPFWRTLTYNRPANCGPSAFRQRNVLAGKRFDPVPHELAYHRVSLTCLLKECRDRIFRKMNTRDYFGCE